MYQTGFDLPRIQLPDGVGFPESMAVADAPADGKSGPGLLHICIGRAPERLAAMPSVSRRQEALHLVRTVAACLPTVFVVGERQVLCEELRDLPGTVLRSTSDSALSAAGIEAFLNRARTIVLTGLEAPFGIYATAAELVYCTHWQILVPQDAVPDRHALSHGGRLRHLAQGYACHLTVLPPAALWQALGVAGRC